MPRKILLADDGPAIRQVVALTFLDRDYEILSVDNGDEALALLHQASPDLVLADVHMPGASGYEVCRQTKMIAGDVPVLLLVGNLEPFSEAAARECGADGMLRKPFDSKELLTRVDDLLAASPEQPRAKPATAAEGEEAGGVRDAGRDDVLVAAPGSAREASSRDAANGAGSVGEITAIASGSGADEPRLSNEDVERIARRVLELMSQRAFEELAWSVVPDMAEVVVRDRLRELEAQLEELG